MRVIIIDDEKNAITALRAMLEEFVKSAEVVGTASNGKEGLELINNVKADVILLDMNMPKMDGIEMLENLGSRDFKVVITSAYEDYAIKAIKNRAFDYLLKPINVKDLEKVMAAIEKELRERTSSRLIKFSDKKGIVHVKLDDIFYFKGDGRYSEVNCANGQKYYISKNLGEYEEELKREFFFRAHKSYLINCKHVVSMNNLDGGNVELTNGASIPISRHKKTEFVEFMKQ
jgi:two-component system, LytTR family, response regulator